MQTVKSGLIISLSNSCIFIAMIFFANVLNAQVNHNSSSQVKSPNANNQIGNGNVNKHQTINKRDNRKYYKTQNENNIENNNYSGPLISGDNPYIVVNNIYPNIDSINYVIQVKKKRIRIALAEFMTEGYLLREQCYIDSNYTELNAKLINWKSRVFKYLIENLDLSYARQFELAETNDAIVKSGSREASKLWNLFRACINKLDQFISSLY